MSEEVVIETQDLGKVYTDFWGRPRNRALSHLSLRVFRGEVFGLLGPNGSGKTTTMKILLGLLFPTEGKATVLGKDPLDVHVKERIGFLPEESYLYRFLNAVETLHFYGKLFGIPSGERSRRVDELIRALGLWDARKRPLREYSKGMARRIGIAQALINDPEVIFLDEPTSGLDPLISRQIKDLILDLKRRGKTILLSSHLLADVEDVCDRIAILHEGKLERAGPVRELLTVRDTILYSVKDLSPDQQRELEKRMAEWVAHYGGSLDGVEHPTETLEALFLKTIGRSTASGSEPSKAGRRPGPEVPETTQADPP